MVAVGVTEYDAFLLPVEVFRAGAARYKIDPPGGWSWYRAHVAPDCDFRVLKMSGRGEDVQVVYEDEEG